jgi:3-oxoacyl-ACP reductase-like protein
MGFFSNILSKLGFDGEDKSAPAAAPAATEAAPVLTAATNAPAPTPIQAIPVSVVDVVGQLEAKAAASTEKLNWKTSIVDLLKLVGLDSSLAARKELATELGCPADKMGDSAQMNMWLHKVVLQKLATNGGNIPKELL